MESISDLNDVPSLEYCGHILLSGDFSVELKKRVAKHIDRYRKFEDTGSTAILYIAAWQGEKEKIWYEYTSHKFMNLLGCENSEVAEVFRDSIIDRRIYKDLDVDVGIRKEVKNREELDYDREALREEGKKAGTIEAVYKLAVNSNGAVWLKDQATVEIYEQDGVCLSLGFLTVVSKEMEAEDELKKHRDRLEEVVYARTAELTLLNEQLKQEIAERKLAEEKLQQSHAKLQKNLDEIVSAMSLTAEKRDPYTAGHQKRTTELAMALAVEMGLSEHQIKGVQMAGLIHDVGKISIPAEILSKPCKLNEDEIQLVKRHPQAAFEILKKIDFPWPVDLIVLQHHEKMDRSGYPQGLAGEDILLEARILCVADVVESIESHRPYRPGLGIDKALEEISKNRGVLFDPDVVDACLKLFRDKGFQY
ncbi:MAG: HD domain-containing phosphohydrolase [Desulfobacterales bacterium]|jgi:HD-GYP domain-containing protein (c-di-GMP phosphodiesterase class II)